MSHTLRSTSFFLKSKHILKICSIRTDILWLPAVFQCLDVPTPLFNFPTDRHLGCFRCFVIMNKATMNNFIHIILYIGEYSCRVNFRNGIAGMFIILVAITKLSSPVTVPIYSPTSNVGEQRFFFFFQFLLVHVCSTWWSLNKGEMLDIKADFVGNGEGDKEERKEGREGAKRIKMTKTWYIHVPIPQVKITDVLLQTYSNKKLKRMEMR